MNILRSLSFIVASAAACSLMGAYTAGASLVPRLPVPKDAAMIFNAGNGDVAGFRIVVQPNGEAAAVDGAGFASNELQPAIVQKFFADLAAASPLAALQVGDCASRQSADSTTTVEVNAPIVISWKGQNSPELRCVSNPRAVKVVLDAAEIQRALYVQAYRKRWTLALGAYSSGSYSPAGSAYASGYSMDSSGFHVQPFSNGETFSIGSFSNSNFDMGAPFSSGGFDSGFVASNGPWSSASFGNPSFGYIPYVTPFSALTTTSVTTTNPFASSPVAGAPTSSNATKTGPFTNPATSSGPPVASHP